MDSKTTHTIGNSTPITTALAITMMGLSFWVGSTVNDLTQRIIATEKAVNDLDDVNQQQWTRTNDILSELRNLSRHTEYRVDQLEKRAGFQ